MYEKQNKHYTFNVFPERNVRKVIFRFLVSTVGKSKRKSEFVSIRACSFYNGGIANLHKCISHQMKTGLTVLVSVGSIVQLAETIENHEVAV